jgi:hypothetical protein
MMLGLLKWGWNGLDMGWCVDWDKEEMEIGHGLETDSNKVGCEGLARINS